MWREGDYSATNKLTGQIFTEKEKTNPFNLTEYTITIRLFKRWNDSDFFNQAAAIVAAASGTWSLAITSTMMPFADLYQIEAEVSKSVEVMSSQPEECYIKGSPS